MPKKREVEFEPEIQEYLKLKSPSTAHAYSISIRTMVWKSRKTDNSNQVD